jgi:hypothetical protein
MKKFLSIVLFCVSVAAAPLAHATGCTTTNLGNGVTCNNAFLIQGSSATNLQATFSPTAGDNILIIAYGCGVSSCISTAYTGTLSILDNLNNPETCFALSPSYPHTFNNSAGTTLKAYIWDCPSIPAGITNIQVAYSVSAAFAAAWFIDMSGLAASSPIDIDGTAQSASSGTTGTVTTTASTSNASDIIFGMIDNDNDESQSSFASGYNKIICDGGGNGCVCAKPVSAAASQTFTASWTGSDSWEGYIIALKDNASSSSGGGGFGGKAGMGGKAGAGY